MLLARRRIGVLIGVLGFVYIVVTLLYIEMRIDDIDVGEQEQLNDVKSIFPSKYPGSDATLNEGTATANGMRRVYSGEDIRDNAFFRFRLVGQGWLVGHSSFGVYFKNKTRERTLGVLIGLKEREYAIQSWTGHFLSVHRDESVGFDARAPRSAEMWEFYCIAKGSLSLWSVSRNCFVRAVRGRLFCDTKESGRAAQWEVYTEPDPQCRASDFGDWNKAARACWIDDSLRMEISDKNTGKIVLFGTSKPLKTLAPGDPNNAHDAFIIANRTLTNWALIEGVQPVVLSADPGIRKLVGLINEKNAKMGIGQRIDIISDSEVHKNFDQPTYRGLFVSVMRAYPDAAGFMFSNMDILYANTLSETLGVTQLVYHALREQGKASSGWFVVGIRRNILVPASWSLTKDCDHEVEHVLGNEAVLFQTLSEDYFAVSREMFNWSTIPDFVVGGTAFDNWLTTKAVELGISGKALVIDATLTLTAIHQNHGHNILASHLHPKSRYNNRLAIRLGGWKFGRTVDAPFMAFRRVDGAIVLFEKLSVLVE